MAFAICTQTDDYKRAARQEADHNISTVCDIVSTHECTTTSAVKKLPGNAQDGPGQTSRTGALAPIESGQLSLAVAFPIFAQGGSGAAKSASACSAVYWPRA